MDQMVEIGGSEANVSDIRLCMVLSVFVSYKIAFSLFNFWETPLLITNSAYIDFLSITSKVTYNAMFICVQYFVGAGMA
jgi:hypothetical protein